MADLPPFEEGSLPPPPAPAPVAKALPRRQRMVLAVLAAAVAGFAAGIACVAIFHDDQPPWAVWLLLAVVVMVPFVLIAGPASDRRAMAWSGAAVLVALVPWALAVHALLPHDWLGDMRHDLGSLQVAGLQYNGRDRTVPTCTDYLWGEQAPYAYERTYVAAPGTDQAEIAAAVDAHFAALGYAIAEPGRGSRGPVDYRRTMYGRTVIIELSGGACPLL